MLEPGGSQSVHFMDIGTSLEDSPPSPAKSHAPSPGPEETTEAAVKAPDETAKTTAKALAKAARARAQALEVKRQSEFLKSITKHTEQRNRDIPAIGRHIDNYIYRSGEADKVPVSDRLAKLLALREEKLQERITEKRIGKASVRRGSAKHDYPDIHHEEDDLKWLHRKYSNYLNPSGIKTPRALRGCDQDDEELASPSLKIEQHDGGLQQYENDEESERAEERRGDQEVTRSHSQQSHLLSIPNSKDIEPTIVGTTVCRSDAIRFGLPPSHPKLLNESGRSDDDVLVGEACIRNGPNSSMKAESADKRNWSWIDGKMVIWPPFENGTKVPKGRMTKRQREV